jgi:hypothetical protein
MSRGEIFRRHERRSRNIRMQPIERSAPGDLPAGDTSDLHCLWIIFDDRKSYLIVIGDGQQTQWPTTPGPPE